ncbi:DUF1481 domain-containing protein [Vibrio sp. SS-MA-C1-2]|uniref:DUF1481 domain-containing protein n=1 Tax=Vibrio sp. SS-MA-C1-2 TaxID=2908646 RepID=UPI001F4781D4|nr:DUF1481 domain-containing protein [Vibrio sp. SS-MA-C1-2]UJF19175.1 DUF1481 domain-containing protein [Vibrio sp. SS-MA-C1-2]
MKKILSICILLLLTGCASSGADKIKKAITIVETAGKNSHSGTDLYWLDSENNNPTYLSVSKHSMDYSYSESSYRWKGKVLREVKQKGEVISHGQSQPFSLHVRFNNKNQPIYQFYQIGESRLPLEATQFSKIKKDYQYALAFIDKEHKKNRAMYQIFFHNGEFSTCDGEVISVSFENSTVENEVMTLEAQNKLYHLVVIADKKQKLIELGSDLKIEQLLATDHSATCIARPELVEKEET